MLLFVSYYIRYQWRTGDCVGFEQYLLAEGVGGTQQSFIWGGSALGFNPSPSYMPFLTEKVLLSYTFH